MTTIKEKWIELARRHHLSLTLLVSLSLFALLAIQAYWIHVEISLQEQKLNEHMQVVLLDMHHQIENDAELSEKLITVFRAYQQGKAMPQDTARQIQAEVQQMMDSVLHAYQLSSLTYDFAFYHTQKEEIILSKTDHARALDAFTSYSERAGYRVRNEFGKGLYRFGIYFQNKFWYLLQQSLGLFIISFLLILVLMGSFASTLLALDKQRKITRMHNDFINNLAHELKTPVFASSVIFKIIDRHQKAGNYKKLKEPLQLLEKENQLLKEKLERVLDVASFEAGPLALQMRTLDLHTLLSETAAPYRYQAQARGGELSLQLQADHAQLIGDEGYLQNLLQNLLDNALKYSPEKPQIRVATLQEKDHLQLEVEDQGIGMSQEEQLHVFDKFYRVQNGNAHDTKGFGLGLSFVKLITDMHGGSIEVKSSRGQGSCFILKFPITQTTIKSHAIRT